MIYIACLVCLKKECRSGCWNALDFQSEFTNTDDGEKQGFSLGGGGRDIKMRKAVQKHNLKTKLIMSAFPQEEL